MQADLRRNIAFHIYYAGILLLVASLPLSKFMMSVSQFMIAGGWLIHGNVIGKFRTFFNSRMGLVLASVYVLHVIGMLYTTDLGYGWKDLRIKLPLLVLPVLLVSGPAITQKQFEGILLALIGSVVVSTFISWLVFLDVIHRPFVNIRDICIFISHIRLALLCCLSVVAVVWLIIRHRNTPEYKKWLPLLIVIPWLIFFLVLIESLTGIIILLVLSMIALSIYAYRKRNRPVKWFAALFVIIVPLVSFLYVWSIHKKLSIDEKIDIAKLDSLTIGGRPYEHHPDIHYVENGHYVYNYISWIELHEQWPTRSKYPLGGKDDAGQQLQYTLIRFLTSKGLRKDSTGIATLTDSEVRSIESGIANVDYQYTFNIGNRVHQTLWELEQYRLSGDPSGHSVAQRIEFWKAATGIIKDHPIAGVGTGDVPDAFKRQYEKMQSQLDERWRLRSHNQYLSIAVAFGITGLLWFIFTLIYPLIRQSRSGDYLYVFFVIISILSMITEDTLETQAGITFFALFTCIFLFVNPQNRGTDGI